MAQWEGLGARRRGDVRREGGGGAVTWEGARRRSDASDVFVVLRVERSSRLAVWDRDWAVTSASRSSRVVRVAPGWGRMPWNGSRGGEGSRRTVRVAEVMEGEERTAA